MPLVNQKPAKEFRSRGPFNNAVDYDTDDRVSYNGMSYVAPEPIPAGEGVPNPGTNKWIDDPGSEGLTGNTGRTGNHFVRVYIRSETTPAAPTGTWDGRALSLQGGWSETIPSGTDKLWVSDGTLNNIANTAAFQAPQEYRGPVGPEPDDARLNTLIQGIITSQDLQDAAQVQAAIAQYLTDNNYLTDAAITERINAAYLNVLRDLGAIQVQYSLDGIDYEDMLNTYQYVRIRLNNPDADWNIIEVGQDGGGNAVPIASVDINAHILTLPQNYAEYNMMGFTMSYSGFKIAYAIDINPLKTATTGDYLGVSPGAPFHSLFEWDSAARTLTGLAGQTTFEDAYLYTGTGDSSGMGGTGGGLTEAEANALIDAKIPIFVPDADVAHTNNEITLTISGITAYRVGMQVIFEVKGLATPANVRIQINGLNFKSLLKFDGSEFMISELRQGIQIIATYNGTHFVSNFKEEPHFHYVRPANVGVSNNAYTITDNDIVGFGVTPPSMIGFEAKEDNTGDVTLSVNGSNALPVRLSNGAEIPAGELQDDQFILVVYAGGWNAINLHPTRSLKGRLLATCNIPVGTHTEDTIFPWSVESGVTYVTADTLPANLVGSNVATPNGVLEVPLTRGDRLSQLGWYLEILDGSTVIYERFYQFNNYVRHIETAITATDGFRISLTYWEPFPPSMPEPLFVVAVKNIVSGGGTSEDITVPAGKDYNIRLYISEN